MRDPLRHVLTRYDVIARCNGDVNHVTMSTLRAGHETQDTTPEGKEIVHSVVLVLERSQPSTSGPAIDVRTDVQSPWRSDRRRVRKFRGPCAKPPVTVNARYHSRRAVRRP